MNILRCCTGFLSGLFATRPDGQSGRRGFVIGVMIGAMLMVGAPGWLPQGGVIPAAQAKPPTPTKPPTPMILPEPNDIIDFPNADEQSYWAEQGRILFDDSPDLLFSFSRTPISVGTHDGWWLLVTRNIGPFTLPMPDLDQDGVVEIGQAWDRFDHHELQIWLSSVGPRGTRQPDIVIAERFNTQTHAFSRIGAAEDVDGDGVREITTLGVATNRSNNQGVPILSVYRSTTGRPSLTLFGSDADILMAVLEGRATGHRADNLLSVIRDSDPLVANFSAERSRSGLAQALGTVVATESIQYDPWVMDGMAISPLVLERADPDVGVWSEWVALTLQTGAVDGDSIRPNLFSSPEEVSEWIAKIVGSSRERVGGAVLFRGQLTGEGGVDSVPFSYMQMDGNGRAVGEVPGGTAIVRQYAESPLLNSAMEQARDRYRAQTGRDPVNLTASLALVTLAGVGGMESALVLLMRDQDKPNETVAMPLMATRGEIYRVRPDVPGVPPMWTNRPFPIRKVVIGASATGTAIMGILMWFGISPGPLAARAGILGRCPQGGNAAGIPCNTPGCVAAAGSDFAACVCAAKVQLYGKLLDCAILMALALMACAASMGPQGLLVWILCVGGLATATACFEDALSDYTTAVEMCLLRYRLAVQGCYCT